MNNYNISSPLFFIGISLILVCNPILSKAQSSGILTYKNKFAILNDSIKKEFFLEDSILKIYQYADKSGKYLTVFNEIKGPYKLENNVPSNIKAIAINFKMENSKLNKMWGFEKVALPDYLVGVQNIIFLDSLIELNDLDHDSIVEPIIVYKTLTETNLSVIYNNLVSSIVFHHKGYNKKTLVVDKSFYGLSQIIKTYLELKLKSMEKTMNLDLPEGWIKKLQKQKLIIQSKY